MNSDKILKNWTAPNTTQGGSIPPYQDINTKVDRSSKLYSTDFSPSNVCFSYFTVVFLKPFHKDTAFSIPFRLLSHGTNKTYSRVIIWSL